MTAIHPRGKQTTSEAEKEQLSVLEAGVVERQSTIHEMRESFLNNTVR